MNERLIIQDTNCTHKTFTDSSMRLVLKNAGRRAASAFGPRAPDTLLLVAPIYVAADDVLVKLISKATQNKRWSCQ